jgi:hypothetical protein
MSPTELAVATHTDLRSLLATLFRAPALSKLHDLQTFDLPFSVSIFHTSRDCLALSQLQRCQLRKSSLLLHHTSIEAGIIDQILTEEYPSFRY